MRIYTRAEWGARYRAGFGPVSLPVAEVWLHHTVTAPPPNDLAAEARAMRQIEDIGQSRFGGGVSYTFAVMPSGRVYEGTGAGRRGAHTGGRNSISHAIVLVGNYDRVGMSPAQERAIADLLAYGRVRGWWKQARLTGGHRDTKATGCPGNAAYARIGHINSLVGVAPALVPTSPEEDDEMIYLFWSEGAVYETDGRNPSTHGLHPNRIAYIEKHLRHKWLPDHPAGRNAKHEMRWPVQHEVDEH